MARKPCTSRNGDRKKRWPNQEAALFVAHKAALTSPHSRAVYECKACGGWHLSTWEDRPHVHRRQGNRGAWTREHPRPDPVSG